MNWNDHSKDNLPEHALLSPSGYHWINYANDGPEIMNDKLTKKYFASMRAPAGTAIHDFAACAITKKEKLPKSTTAVIKMIKFYMVDKYSEELIDFISMVPEVVFKTLILYVNDCIGFRMDAEKTLMYSKECFGHTDAISFENNTLRISDFKSGDAPAHMEQLLIYAALFCLEYHFKPNQINIETRLYQFGEVQELLDIPDEIILSYMNIIVTESKFIQRLKGRE